MNRVYLFAFLSLLFAACASRPTKVVENPERKTEVQNSKSNGVKVTAETLVIDARSAFDYTSAHVPKSVNLQWSEFSEPEPASPGLLQADTFAIARRLARLGIGPGVPILVVGYGHEGRGEEGRLAWMLQYLGVEKVQFADLDSMKFRLTNLAEGNPPKSVPMWKPALVDELLVTRQEMTFAINRRAMFEPASFKEGWPPRIYRIIDVRSAADYLGREGFGAKKPVPNMEAVNIPWREFFTPSLQPLADMAGRLRAIGVLPEHRVIVLGAEGVSSAAVTLALRSLGYEHAGNYAGGLMDLMSTTPGPF